MHQLAILLLILMMFLLAGCQGNSGYQDTTTEEMRQLQRSLSSQQISINIAWHLKQAHDALVQ